MNSTGVLFVSHDASRTGGPISLLHFLRWFKSNTNRPFSILLGADGEIRSSFEELGPTWCMRQSRWRADSLRTNLLLFAKLGHLAHRAERADVREFAASCSPAVVYANCIASALAIDLLGPEVRILTHVHELEYSFQVLASPALSELIVRSHRLIACSRAVAENLVLRHGLSPERLDLIYESIPVHEVKPRHAPNEMRDELRVPQGARLVVAGGSHNWRKGGDIFLQIAREVCRRHSETYFAWIGGTPSDIAQLEFDRTLMCLDDRVRLTGSVPNPADYLAAADVFVLTSREDPYPLIALEAAALSKPIVCFADAGGIPEFVENDCGFVVPYIDVAAMAERIMLLLSSSTCRSKMGEAAKRKVTDRHDVRVSAPRIMDIIERTISGA